MSNNESYETKAKDEVPVVADDAENEVDDQVSKDSDAQLEKDEQEAIDKSNIVSGRTRGAKPDGGYSEPDEDDLPAEAVETQ